MNLLPSPEQIEIVDTLKSFLATEAPIARLRGQAKNSLDTDGHLWAGLAALGFMGVSIEESLGGVGLTAAEEMLVYREFGRFLVSPVAFGITLGARIAALCGDLSLLGELLNGSVRVGIANPRGDVTLGSHSSGPFHLIGSREAALVLVCDREGSGLFRREVFTDIDTVPGTDSVLTLERARLERAIPELWVNSGTEPIYRRGQLLLGAFAVGMAEATRDMAVEYAKVREQFGRPIGSFQAVKHRCAEMAIRSEAALCQAAFASLALSSVREDSEFQVRACRIVATDAALRNAADNIQVHGAFGFTAEADAHLFLKRAHLIDLLWGNPRSQRAHMLDALFPG